MSERLRHVGLTVEQIENESYERLLNESAEARMVTFSVAAPAASERAELHDAL